MSRPLLLALLLLVIGGGALGQEAPDGLPAELGIAVGDSVTYGEDRLAAAAFAERLGAEVSPAGGLVLYRTNGGPRLVHVRQTEIRPGAAGIDVIRVPLWLSLLPPLIAIGLALVFKEVVVSLFVGVLSGGFIAGGLRFDSPLAALYAFWNVASDYFVRALNDAGHISVMVFSLLIGGMVALISRNGGMAGVVDRLARFAHDRRSAQLSTYVLGVAIFFDDYANTLIVGNTMRPVTDRFGVSREKLAYLVDATAAPIASVAFITTWIGAELGYIDSGLSAIADFPVETTPYAVFLASLRYSYYPVLTLVFIVMLIRSGRDFGPMLAAERSVGGEVHASKRGAVDEGEFSPVAGASLKSRFAVLPVATVIAVTIFGLLHTGLASLQADVPGVAATAGYGEVWAALTGVGGESIGFFRKLGLVIGAADSYVALLWASLSGVVVALAMTLSAGIMTLEASVESIMLGFKTMLPALVILTLAWSLAAVTEDLHTAVFLSSALGGSLSPILLPSLIFVLAAFISFATGSSWSTMAILYPIAIPTTWAVALASGLDVDHGYALLLNVVSNVLAASVLGDHCSPISDTTILSSLASDCNHLAHVRTQMPYALTVGAFALTCTLVSSIFDGGWLLSLALMAASTVGLYFLIRLLGKPSAV